LSSKLPHDERLRKLSLLPTCGTKFYQYSGDWKKLYEEDFTPDEREKISARSRNRSEKQVIESKKVWGKGNRSREGQITFSALGQQAPLEEKNKWESRLCQAGKKIKPIS